MQVLGDTQGNIVHLYERDCSVQRRHQKIIEEAPAPDLPQAVREGLLDAALRFARSIGYTSAGTVEFLYDAQSQGFYFLEMNTRIQVEHPVTEAITGVDLVAEQIRIAQGDPISVTQEQISVKGHAIECRINVEDPDRDFMPSPGRLNIWDMPQGEHVRIDTHASAGYLVPPYYDSLLAKLICSGKDRGEAIERSLQCLGQMQIEGVHTNRPFHQFVLNHPDFRDMKVSTRWIESGGMNAYLESRRSVS